MKQPNHILGILAILASLCDVSSAQTSPPAMATVTNAVVPAPRHWGFGRADQPSPRSDTNSKLAHEQLLAKARQGGIDIYFEGDSITRRWGTSDAQYKQNLANWNANFFGWNAGDFGWARTPFKTFCGGWKTGNWMA